jgi:heat shock protein HtpX
VARRPLLLDEQIRQNKRRSVLLVLYVVGILTLLIGSISLFTGWPLWFGLTIGLMGGLIYWMMASSFSVEAILSAAQARPADPRIREQKLLIYKVEELAIAAGLPPPKVYVTPSRDINAFATGRNPQEAVVAVTQGALEQLNQEELEGVLAHELSHIKNYDIRIATLTIALVAIVAIIAEIVFRTFLYGGMRGGGGRGKDAGAATLIIIAIAILFYIFAPLLSRLAYLAMSRQREYLADASGAMMTRNPHGLARALEKIKGDLPDDPRGSRTVAALYIANPYKRAIKESLWATHPPLEKRVARLRGMDLETYLKARQMGAT